MAQVISVVPRGGRQTAKDADVRVLKIPQYVRLTVDVHVLSGSAGSNFIRETLPCDKVPYIRIAQHQMVIARLPFLSSWTCLYFDII